MSAPGKHRGNAAGAVGAVLAGGEGSRIGGPKAIVELGGRPLISYPLAALEKAGLEAVVVAKRDSGLPPLDCRLIDEPAQPRHPLCGILAALRYAKGRPLVVVGCDMPFVSPELLAWLASAPEPLVVPSQDGELQPLLARYDGALLAPLESALASGEPLRRTVESLGPRLAGEADLARFGDPQRLCFNVNTPADAQQAEQMLERDGG